jgi:ubiquinone/menaquinone biosynthesis C-methylase UbiE
MTAEIRDYKQAAIEQWTADPCGPRIPDLAPGSAGYFHRLLEGRRAYAPWMSAALGYAGTAGMAVLDVGCGQGLDLAQYAMAGASVTGIDLTPRHVELARAHLDALGLSGSVVLGDAEALPFAEESFDRVSSNGVLHHTPDMGAALREIRRVLRPAAEVRIIVYNRSSLHYWCNQVVLTGLLRGGLLREGSMSGVLSSGVEFSTIGARPLVRVHTPAQVRRMMRQAGLADLRTELRQFKLDDAFLYSRLARVLPVLARPSVLDRVGRLAGWYIVASGIRPPS